MQIVQPYWFSVTAAIPLYLGFRTGRGINRKALVFLHSLAYLPAKASACSAAGKLRSLKFQQEQNENCQSLLQIHRMNRSSW